MKDVILVLAAILLIAASASADIVLFEDFEDAAVCYTTSVPEFTDGSGDFFIRTDDSDNGAFVEYTGKQGDYYFAGMDLNGEGATLPLTMSFSGIDISGYTDLTFSSLFAEDDDGTSEDWDLSDYVHIDYQIDGGGYQALIWFESIPDGDSYNSVPALDTDFDGNGDGKVLTDTFDLFTADITGTGSTLDLRFTFQLNAGDEDIAIDNVQIEGVNPVPVPAAAWLLGSGFVGLIGLRRKHR
jgi:hypothetical protein